MTLHGTWTQEQHTILPQNLAICRTQLTAYLGDAQVMVSNGKYIGISHVRNILLSALVKPIHRKNVLHTPKISKQFISVTKLCVDNKAYIEFFFHSFSCEGSSVKEDSSSRQPWEWLVQGQSCCSPLNHSTPQLQLVTTRLLLHQVQFKCFSLSLIMQCCGIIG